MNGLARLRRTPRGPASLRVCWLVLTFWAGSASARPAAVAEEAELSLAVGENRTLSAAGVKSYSEGTPGVAEVKVTPNGQQFVVVGRRPGSTTLLLIMHDGKEVTWSINVFARPVAVVDAELRQLLDETPGVKVRRVGSRFFIEGGVSSEAELGRIQHIAGLYEGQVESLVVLGGAAADRRINIRIDFFFVQYNKNATYQAGINWPGSIGAASVVRSTFAVDFLAKSITSAQASVVNQPLPSLDLAARNGWAKVLKHVTVITANGSEAEFSSGGAQNFQVANGLTSAIQQISFGTTVKVLPRFDPESREIQVNVGAEVIDLVPPLSAATNLPGQNSSDLSTSAALKLGQSIVLSGIRTESRRRNTAGLPGLSAIPVIGPLFGSVGSEREDVEGAVFIIPSVVENVPQRVSELIDRTLGQFDAFHGDMREVSPFDEAIPRARGGKP